MSIEERFLSKFEILESGCWRWLAAANREGYGVFAIASGRARLAHRYGYELLVGPIPDGLVIDHLCRNRICVNPDHLEPVTVAENNRRQGEAVTVCKYGHEFTEENTIWRKGGNGRRNCRTCVNAWQREWWHRRKQKETA